MKLGFFIINNVVGGGGMVATQDAINALSDEGHEVIVFMQEIITDNKKHLLITPKARYVECGNLNDYQGVCNLLRSLKKNKIEIFITHCHYYLPIIRCFESIRNLGIKVILNEHHLNFIPIYENRFDLFLERERYLKSVNLITVIEKSSYFIWKSKGYPVALLPNTIPDIRRHQCEKKKIILLSGRFTDFKQMELGIVAFSLVSKKYPGWTLKILGQGSRLKSIKNTINNSGVSDRIVLVGWTSNPEQYFEEAAIHILPSFTEPFGLVIADAKKYQVPTVMFDIRSNDLVRNGIDGFKVPMNDVRAMAEKIENLIRNEKIRLAFGKEGIENIREHEVTHVIKIWEQIIRYVKGLPITDEAINKKYFNINLDEATLGNIIYDYDQLLYWIAKKNNRIAKGAKKKSTIGSYIKEFVNYIGNKIFYYASKYAKADRIILWDSNRVGQLRETIGRQKFNMKVSEIVPTGYLTPGVAWNLAKAKVFITNTNTAIIKKLIGKENGRATIINVWHGAGYFKKFGIHEANIGEYEFKNKYGTPDYVLCSSLEIQSMYAEIFGISDTRVLPFGSTRTDLLLDANFRRIREEVFFKKYPKLRGKKLYVIAPTWRGTPFRAETASFNLPIDIDKLKNKLKEDEAILIKNHQLVIKSKKTNLDYEKFDDEKFVTVDAWSMQDLLLVSNTVITDYSSLLFDALVLDKPILMWAPDVEAYNQTIGFYGRYEDYVPGELYKGCDPQELMSKIRNAKNYTKCDKYLTLKKKFISACDGKSSQRLANFINNKLDLTDYRKRWSVYIKEIKKNNNVLEDNKIYWHKAFVKLFIPGLPRSIHYELQGKENGSMTYLCFHIECKWENGEGVMEILKRVEQRDFKIVIKGGSFFEISKRTSLTKVGRDIGILNSVIDQLNFKYLNGCLWVEVKK